MLGTCRRCWVFALALAVGWGCNSSTAGDKGKPGSPQTQARYQLVCDSSDTAKQSTLFCLRHDTQTGDVKRVVVEHIPVSRGPTAAAKEAPGTYQLECHATRSDGNSNLYCVRLQTQSGEMLLVALPKVGVLPEGSQSHSHDGATHTH